MKIWLSQFWLNYPPCIYLLCILNYAAHCYKWYMLTVDLQYTNQYCWIWKFGNLKQILGQLICPKCSDTRTLSTHVLKFRLVRTFITSCSVEVSALVKDRSTVETTFLRSLNNAFPCDRVSILFDRFGMNTSSCWFRGKSYY